MKCDELKQVENPIEWGLYYDKDEVDEAIAELNDKIEELKSKLSNLITDYNFKDKCFTDACNKIKKLKEELAESKRIADYHFKAHKEISGGWRVSLEDYKKKEEEVDELKSINKKLEDAIKKVEERNDRLYSEWKEMFEKWRAEKNK